MDQHQQVLLKAPRPRLPHRLVQQQLQRQHRLAAEHQVFSVIHPFNYSLSLFAAGVNSNERILLAVFSFIMIITSLV